MKKIAILFSIFSLNVFCFAANYRIIKNSNIYDGDYNLVDVIKKDTLVKLWNCFVTDQKNNDKLPFDYCTRININNQKRLIDYSSLAPSETEELFDEKKITTYLNENRKRWIDKDTCDLLYSKDRNNFYKVNQQEIDSYESHRGEYDDVWYNYSYFFNCPELSFNNLYLKFCNNDFYLIAYVLKIDSTEKGYSVKLELQGKGEIRQNYNKLYSFLPEETEDFQLELEFDGDYMYVYHPNGSLMFTNVIVDDSFCVQYESLIRTNSCDLSRVTWPHHADGTCDYDGSSTAKKTSLSSTNVSPNKIMSVTENLKLRSGEATTTSVLTVMSAGTKVKILELGKAETIDGINSNWVKVEVISGKDRDGKEIKKKTTGWCYGGYLK